MPLAWVFLVGYGPQTERMTLAISARELQNCLDWGMPLGKMVLGMPKYSSNGTGGPGYADIVHGAAIGRTVDEHKGWRFNGPATIDVKTRLAVAQGAAGLGWWSVGPDAQDDHSVTEATIRALSRPPTAPVAP